MDPRSSLPPPPGRPLRAAASGGAKVRVGPWRTPRRLLPVALVPILIYLALWTLVVYSLAAAGCRRERTAVPLLGPGARLVAGPMAGASSAGLGGATDQGMAGAGSAGSGSATGGGTAGAGTSAGADFSTPRGLAAGAASPIGAGSPAAPGASAAAGFSTAADRESVVMVLVETARFAPPRSDAASRFDIGWEVREIGGREAMVPASGSGRLLAVNLGEEVPRTLTLDLARAGLPEGERLSVRTGDREVAQATLRAAALPLRVRLPDDLPVGLVPLDLVFGPPAQRASVQEEAGGEAGRQGVDRPGIGEPAPPAASRLAGTGTPASRPASLRGRAAGPAAPGAAGGTTPGPGDPARPGNGSRPGVAAPPGAPGRPGIPALYGASLTPALPAGAARVEGGDVVMGGNCLVYLHCILGGKEALVGTFVPPAGARPGQRFELSVERLDGTPIRRFGWRPSFWNRLRGARGFQLPLRGTRGPVRVRLIARAGDAGGPPGRWRALGLQDVTGEILTPGQGQ